MASDRKSVYHGSRRDLLVKKGELSAVGAQTVTLDLRKANTFRVKTGGATIALAAAYALANDLKVKFNLHLVDTDAHTSGADGDNDIEAADATTWATLDALLTELLTDYDAHEGDSELNSAWSYHAAKEAADCSLVSATGPTDLASAVIDADDLRAKYTTHQADATAHGTVGTADVISVAAVGDKKTTLTFDVINGWDGASCEVMVESSYLGDTLAVLKIDGTAATYDVIEQITAGDYEQDIYNHMRVKIFDTTSSDSIASCGKALVAAV